jgi:hypothetical protein
MLTAEDARRALDVFVAFLGHANRARLLVFDESCDDSARATLLRERAELDLESEIALVGDAPAERYAAFRAARVAMAVGRPLDVVSAVTPLWFDIPVVALGDPVAVDTVEASGLIEDRFEPRRFAALLRLVASDDGLRAAIRNEGRRSRERHLPRTVAATVVEQLATVSPGFVPSVPR